MKEQLGRQIETLRKELKVSTYDLEQKGIHPSLPSTIEIKLNILINVHILKFPN